MSKWKYTLPNSKELRKAIEDEDSDAIFREIIKAYKWMETHFGEDNFFEINHVEDDLEISSMYDDDKQDSAIEMFINDNLQKAYQGIKVVSFDRTTSWVSEEYYK